MKPTFPWDGDCGHHGGAKMSWTAMQSSLVWKQHGAVEVAQPLEKKKKRTQEKTQKGFESQHGHSPK